MQTDIKSKNKLIEILTLFFVVAGFILLARSHTSYLLAQKQKENIPRDLKNVREALLLYYTANLSYPSEEAIFDIYSLKDELSLYLKETRFNFSYIYYKNKNSGQNFELKVKKGEDIFIITPKQIRVIKTIQY